MQVIQISHPAGSKSGTLISIRQMRSLRSALEFQRWALLHVLSCQLYRRINQTVQQCTVFCLTLPSTDGKKVRGGFNRNVLVFGGKESSFNGLRHVNSTVSFSLCSSSNSNWRTCFHKAHSNGVRFTIFSLE